MKIAIVFTQCDNDEELANGKGKDAEEFKSDIMKTISGISFFETAAIVKSSLDLEKLIEWSCDVLPNDQLRSCFIVAQKLSIKKKKKEAYKIVGLAVVTTGATGALNPLPVADAILIAPQQLAMCVKITNIFWLNSGLSGAIMDLLKTQIVSMVGKQIAASLLKLIPGFGQLINGLVAAGITGGLGSALIEGNASALNIFLDTGKPPEWAAIFSSDTFINSVKEAVKNKSWEDNQ
jgi:uncharacterized protein (DUF697 family)